MKDYTLTNRLNAHISLCRPFAWFWFVFLTCIAFGCILLKDIVPLSYLKLILIVILTDSASTTINDVGDVEVDRLSKEENRRNRPIVTGIVTKRAAILQAIILYSLALYLAATTSHGVLFMIAACVLYSSGYSLNPVKLSGRPITSLFFWPLLWLGYYFLNICFLEGLSLEFTLQFFGEFGAAFSKIFTSEQTLGGFLHLLFIEKLPSYELLEYGGNVMSSIAGLIYLAGIIFFMGLGEIMAKDLRDYYNDKEGGKLTFVNTVGVAKVSFIIPIVTLIGLILWLITFAWLDVLTSPFAIITLIVGVLWLARVIHLLFLLRANHKQEYCVAMHKGWINAYIIMQTGTILAFI